MSAVSQIGAVRDAGRQTGREVVTLGLAVTLSAVAIDVLLTGRLTIFFDLCFVALCLALAALVRRGDFFAVGLLPPVLMLVVFAFLALVARDTIADPRDNPAQAVVTGIAHHSQALLAGYAVCLGWLAWRLRSDDGGSLEEIVR